MKKIQISEKLMSNRRIVLMTNTVRISKLNIRCFFVDYLNREQIKTFKDMEMKDIEKSLQEQKLISLKKEDIIKIGSFDFKVDVIKEDYVRLVPLVIEDIGIYSYTKDLNDLDFPF